MKFKIRFVKNSFVLKNWKNVSIALAESFAKARFNESFDIHELFEEVLNDCVSNKECKHLLLFGESNEIVGGIFSIPIVKSSLDYCDVGWYFTLPSLSLRSRLSASDLLINKMHSIIKKLGYRRILTQIGTKKGENILKKRYGYNQVNADENIWERLLR